ncbi:MAG: DUF5677 domain-containing protein [Reyranella sp.]|nr:DUF5677 domain-containing protein [Reyranella sp.]MDP3162978.1 DUF5677 domain-containing protein [Reyranella sp.]
MKKPKRRKSKRPTYSSLKQHTRSGKKLSPPLRSIGNVNLQSWINDRLPDVLWAVLLTQLQPREKYLAMFRQVSDGARQFKDSKAYLTHTELAVLSDAEFDELMAPVLVDENARAALSALRLFDALPDKHHWFRSLPEHSSNAWDQVAHAILHTSPHQSEAATDIRWLKVRFMILQGRLQFPVNLEEKIKEILDFPSRGDMRSVRPSIRSMEGAVGALLGDQPRPWCSDFWQECLKKTPCAAISERAAVSEFPYEEANKLWATLYSDCAKHCIETITTTAIDARHDGTFGLVLYGMTLVASVFGPNSARPAGRIMLRTLVETYLTLAYLVKKDDPKLWIAYRSYGGGQAKLAFLKLVEIDDLPRYIDLDALEALANEDVWQEYIEIDLGHWANKDLRRISEEVGVKPIYDKFYGWPSTFVHAQWGAVRSTVFAMCLNPLHRLHRVPRPPRTDFEDVSWDALKLGNLILELLNQAYPSFAPRFRLPPQKSTARNAQEETSG